MDQYYLSWPLKNIFAEAPFPGDVFLCLRHRIVKFRHAGDTISTEDYDRFLTSGVKVLFIPEEKKDFFISWAKKQEAEQEKQFFENTTEEQRPVVESVVSLRRGAFDLFDDPQAQLNVPGPPSPTKEQSKRAVQLAKDMVSEFMKRPYVVNNISQLQSYGRGSVDHSVNVAVLSVFLGLRLGYTSQVILEHLALGGLLHDIGKAAMGMQNQKKGKDQSDQLIEGTQNEELLELHPQLGKDLVEKSQDIPNEVKMIIGQHHEFIDGSGYPNGLRGTAVYDLARVVTIANVYDNLISEIESVDIPSRCRTAIERLAAGYQKQLDQKKLEKVVKILKTSLT